MKPFFLSIIMSLSAIMALSAQPRSAGYPHYPVRDLGLIYAAGGPDRPDWTRDELRPYVAHTFSNGETHWLFDGFLFVEFHTRDPKLGWIDLIPIKTDVPPMKRNYVEYMDKLFASGTCLDALDKEIGELKKEIGDPGFRHKVILTLFVPYGGSGWGKLNGREMNFENFDDKVEVVNWMLNQLVARFNAAHYENLELVGMYWPFEELRQEAGELALAVSEKVHAKNLKFCWIPWYKAPGSDRWQDYGFDMVYQQPNYFVWPKAEKQQLDDACQRARDYNMGLEFEAGPKCLSDNTADGNDPVEYAGRFKAYLTAFKKQGAKTHAPIAYYTDTKLLLQFTQNPTKQNRQLADELARFIVDRQKIKRLDP